MIRQITISEEMEEQKSDLKSIIANLTNSLDVLEKAEFDGTNCINVEFQDLYAKEDSMWRDAKKPDFTNLAVKYRIKEIKYRPFKNVKELIDTYGNIDNLWLKHLRSGRICKITGLTIPKPDSETNVESHIMTFDNIIRTFVSMFNDFVIYDMIAQKETPFGIKE